MVKKVLGIVTSVVAALAVVGVAWASGDNGTSTSITSATGSTSTSETVSSSEATGTSPDASAATSASTPTSVTSPTSSTPTTVDDTTSTSSGTSTSTSSGATTSTSNGATTSTSNGSSTSTSSDDSDRRTVPDGVSTHALPGVGSVTVEVKSGRLSLVSVTAPGWKIERQRVEADRIDLELASGEDRARFEARVNNGRMEVDVKVDSD